MKIRINSHANDPYLEAAEELVKAFATEHPSLGKEEIEARVTTLAKVIFQNAQSAPSQHKETISIPVEAFPADMRTWASNQDVSGLIQTEIETRSGRLETVQSPLFTFSNTDWSDVQIVQKAHTGVRGAWFLSHESRGSVVIKGQENAEQQIMGTAFLRCMGVNAPDARMVSIKTQEGNQLSNLAGPYGLNDRKPTHYILMDRVYGPNYNNLTLHQEDIQLVQNNLEQLGELVIYDLVLGNLDRFELNEAGFNGGNIMFQQRGLCPIDTDCNAPTEEGTKFTLQALKKIANGTGGYEGKICRKLASHLAPPNGIDPSIFSEEKIKAGLMTGLKRVAALAANLESNKQAFLQSCAERGCPLSQFPAHVEKFVLHIKSCYKG